MEIIHEVPGIAYPGICDSLNPSQSMFFNNSKQYDTASIYSMHHPMANEE